MARLTGNYFNFVGGLNTESSVLNNDPTAVTEISNCTINRDGSIQQRAGLEHINYITEPTQDSFFKAEEWKFNNQYMQIVSSKNLLHIYEGQFPNVTLKYTVTDTSDTTISYTVEGEYCYIFKTDITDNTYLKYTFGDTAASEENVRFRDDVTQQFTGIVTGSAEDQLQSSTPPDDLRQPLPGDKIKLTNSTDPDDVIFVEVISSWYNVTFDYITIFIDISIITDTVVYDVEYSSTAGYPDKFNTGIVTQSRLFGIDDGVIYYTQVGDHNKAYAEANPFDPDDNAVVATDGGVIKDTGIGTAYAMEEIYGSVLIFADNGVWQLSGSDGVFSAGEISIRKISEFGSVSKDAVSKVDGSVAYLSTRGMMVLSKTDDYSTSLGSLNISDDKIKTYWNTYSIPELESMRLVFDDTESKMYIFITSDDAETALADSALVFDMTLKSWYKYVYPAGVNGGFVSTIETIPADAVLHGTGGATDTVTTDEGESVVISAETSKGVREFVVVGKTSVMLSNDDNLTDIYSEFLTGEDVLSEYIIESYFSSTHQTYKDIFRKKTPNYMKILFERSESDVEDEYGRDITPGGCLLRTSLNFADDPLLMQDEFGEDYVSNNDWGRYREAYPPIRSTVSPLGNRTRGYSNVSYNHKLLGNGDVLQFNFKSTHPERYFQALTSTFDYPLSSDDWEEITDTEGVDEYVSGSEYVEDDIVKITQPTRFKIIGWACDIIAVEKGSRGS